MTPFDFQTKHTLHREFVKNEMQFLIALVTMFLDEIKLF